MAEPLYCFAFFGIGFLVGMLTRAAIQARVEARRYGRDQLRASDYDDELAD